MKSAEATISPRVGWITYTPQFAEDHKTDIRKCGLPECRAPYIIGFEDDYCSIGCWAFAKERREGC